VAALRRLIRRRWVVTLVLQVPESTAPTPLVPGVSVRQATADDLMALRPLNSGGELPERRFARGDTALVAELDGCLVGCQWISDAPLTVPYLRVSVAPRPGARYCYGFYVRPEVRRRGIGRALEQALLQEADRTGVRAYWCHSMASIASAWRCTARWAGGPRKSPADWCC
jgi:GNAT superfamily N-acetyltransferase